MRRARVAAVLLAVATLAIAARQAAGYAPPSLGVRGAALIKESTGQLLYGVHPFAELPIASTTKLMTALVTLERVRSLSTIYAQNDYYAAPADSQIGLVPGERMSVHDLLIALLLPSADDAAEDLAFNVGGGSVGRFIAIMNQRALALGLTHTHYSTPIGLDTPGNYSDATDLCKLAAYLLRTSPFFAHVVALPSATLYSGNHVRRVTNRNDLVARFPRIQGVKTGQTTGAGYVLVGSGTRDGMTLIIAVLGTTSPAARDANPLALLDYGFANFRLRTPVVALHVIARPRVSGQPGLRVRVIAARTFSSVFPLSVDVHTRVHVPRKLVAPLRRHAVVGYVLVFAGRRRVAKIPLWLARALRVARPPTDAAATSGGPSTLLPPA